MILFGADSLALPEDQMALEFTQLIPDGLHAPGLSSRNKEAQLDGYGHYEDEMVKMNGKWLFSKRVIYNEGAAAWIAPAKNPAW